MRIKWWILRNVRMMFGVEIDYYKPPCPRCHAEYKGGSPVFVCNDCGMVE